MRNAHRFLLVCLLLLMQVRVAFADGSAPVFGAASAVPGVCARSGGAPVAPALTLPIGGVLGLGVGGGALAEFIASVERASRPPRPAPVFCDAPRPTGREPASLADPSPERAAGNPVDVVTGNKYERQVDVALAHPQSSSLSPDGIADAFGLPQDDTLSLLLSRHYNSSSDFALSLGRGWSHSYETRLARIVRDGRIELQIVQADGRRIVFRPIAHGGVRAQERLETRAGTRAAIRRGAAPPAEERRRYGARSIHDGFVDEERIHGVPVAFVWRWPAGRVVRFDRDGVLASIVSADRDRIGLRRDERGRLVEVHDDAGRTIGFEYDRARLVALRLPDGQRIRYAFDPHGQLVAVHYPDGRTLRYEYDDPRAFHRLTAIVDTDGRRSAYRYGEDGRVVFSRGIGERDVQALHFVYSLPSRAEARGSTTVRSGESRTRYQWVDAGGRPMIVASEGDGCRRCPPVGLRVRLGVAGRAVRIGEMRVRYDPLGRVVERRIDAHGAMPAWFERYDYVAGSPWPAPARIVRPSVVPGHEARTELRYNERMQVDEIVFSGYLPDEDGVQPLRATLRFEYAEPDPLPARALLHGRLRGIVRISPDGTRQRTTFRHDAQRRLVAILATATIVHRIERDALGRAVVELLPDGTARRRSFDPAWRVATSAARGTRVSFGYDRAGRPRTIEWSGGERWTIRLAGAGVEIESNHGWRERIVPGARAGTEARVGSGGAGAPATVRGMPVAMARAEPGRHLLVDAKGRRSERLYDDLGRLVETRSAHDGRRRYRYDGLGRLSSIAYADGSVDSREHDVGNRLVRRLQIAPGDRAETRFEYLGARLFSLRHGDQGMIVRHDDEGRVIETVETRGELRFHERLEYDERGRVARQWLADGSRLRHRYDDVGRPEALEIAAPESDSFRTLVRRVAAGHDPVTTLELGNGVRFERRVDPRGRPVSLVWTRNGDAAGGMEHAPQHALPFRRLRWDPVGVPLSIEHERGEDRYAYDRFGRLIVRERHASVDAPVDAARATQLEYFALDALGGRDAVRRRDGSESRGDDDLPRDARGLPTRRGQLVLRYGAQRRLLEASDDILRAHYRYDAFARRIAKDVESPNIRISAAHTGAKAGERGATDTEKAPPHGHRGFLYRDQRLAAEIDGRGRPLRQYLYWNGSPLAVLEQRDGRAVLTWLLTDHLGTPIAALDEKARVVWRGDADAFGGLVAQEGDFFQPLRFAGQYFDAETGLHDNLLRSYDPASGRYLEPDPLGLRAGLDPFVYADGNPLVATDPLGLLLFAFDGTGNGADSRNGEDISNVRRFFEASDDPHKWYMAGVGRDDDPSGITATRLDWAEASTARARVDWMIGTLDRFLDDAWIGRIAPVDVIGFSRGAAMARDFVNRVSSMVDAGHFHERGICVDLRFLGLWDTVAQFGPLGLANRQWELAIPSAVRATFHAVALNEHRRLFPLESALGSAAWVVEQGFVGSHADIGGGNAEGDLADITLVWMTRMAQSLGVPVRDPAPEHAVVTDPLLHDRDYVGTGDRFVNRRDYVGRITQQMTQRTAVVPGLDWGESLAFLVPFRQRQRDATGWPSLVGRVDMEAYGAWLRTVYGIEVRR